MLKKSPSSITMSLMTRNRRTPDFSELRWLKKIPLFVYGSEMQNGSNHKLLEGALFCGRAVTLSPGYCMKSTGSQPYVFSTQDHGAPRNRIKGELWLCSVEHIHNLDYMYLNATATKRYKTRVLMMDQPDANFQKWFGGMPTYNAFMYLGIPDFWEDENLKLRHTIRYVGDKQIGEYPVYEWTNWLQDDRQEDEANDEYTAFWNNNWPEYGYQGSMLH